MPKLPRQRADQLVFEQGLAESREQARRLIMAGKIILEQTVPGAPPQVVPKPGHPFAADTVFALLEPERYVSRGAYKLLTILEHFKLDVTDFVCLDAGASTGGFTDCLLQRGAKRVYAVDVGKNRVGGKRVSRLGNNLRGCAGHGLLQYDLARHDQAACLLAAFGKALFKDQLVGALSG